RLALAAAAFGWRIPKNGATHPHQSWIVRRHCAGFFLRREDLLDPFFLARFILWIRKQEKSQAGNDPNLGINEFGIEFNRSFEFFESTVEISRQFLWINCVIEAVHRPPPLRKAAPVSDARREFFVLHE